MLALGALFMVPPFVTMAAATMTLLPVLVVYVFAQRCFVRGVTLSGLAGR